MIRSFRSRKLTNHFTKISAVVFGDVITEHFSDPSDVPRTIDNSMLADCVNNAVHLEHSRVSDRIWTDNDTRFPARVPLICIQCVPREQGARRRSIVRFVLKASIFRIVVVILNEYQFVAGRQKCHGTVLLIRFPAVRPHISPEKTNLIDEGESEKTAVRIKF